MSELNKVDISIDPITGKDRKVIPYAVRIDSENKKLTMNTHQILVDGSGDELVGKNVKHNNVSLQAEDNEWINPANGQKVDPEDDGSQPAGTVSRFEWYFNTLTVAQLGLDATATLKDVLDAATGAEIAEADSNNLFD